MLSIEKIIKYAGIGIFCFGASTVIYNYFRKLEITNIKSITFNKKNFIEIIHSIEPNEISYVQACGLVKLIKMLDESDLISVLKLVGTISSYSNNITILCESGCIECLLEILKPIKDGSYSEKIVLPLLLCLRTLVCNDQSSRIFLDHIDDFVSCINMRKGLLSNNCLIILCNLTLFPHSSKYLLKYVIDINQWINDDSKEIDNLKAFQILLHISLSGEETRLVILKSEGNFQFIMEFVGQGSSVPNIRNSLIFLEIFFSNLQRNSYDINEGTLNSFLLCNKSAIQARIKELCYNEDEEIRDRSVKLVSILDEFQY